MFPSSIYKYLASAAAGALIVGAVMWMLWAGDVARLKLDHIADVARAEKAVLDKAAENTKITSGVEYDYQRQVTSLRAELAKLRRLRPSTACVPVTGQAHSGDAATGNNKLLGRDGVTADALFDYAAAAERTGRQLDACQQFIREVWGSNP